MFRFVRAFVETPTKPVSHFAFFEFLVFEIGAVLFADAAQGGSIFVEAWYACRARGYSITPPPRHSCPS